MKHHFSDLLDREGDYWTIIPNINRYSYSANKDIKKKESVKVITISKTDKAWKQVFELPNLEEVTLHEPSKEQVESLGKIKKIKRFRISHYRPKTIDFISDLKNLEEVVFEYVSGFSDLSPLSKLTKLKSLHLENLRRVSNFEGLQNIKTLRYLLIDGTLDWKQPIESFEFLSGLHKLEVFALGFINAKSHYPSFLPILNLKKLKRIKIGLATLPTKEYAFLTAALPNVICGTFGGDRWEPCTDFDDEYVFLGKKSGSVKKDNAMALERCQQFSELYENMKTEALQFLNYKNS